MPVWLIYLDLLTSCSSCVPVSFQVKVEVENLMEHMMPVREGQCITDIAEAKVTLGYERIGNNVSTKQFTTKDEDVERLWKRTVFSPSRGVPTTEIIHLHIRSSFIHIGDELASCWVSVCFPSWTNRVSFREGTKEDAKTETTITSRGRGPLLVSAEVTPNPIRT